ncbi:MAG: HDOD domain-containing protein [Pseudomonadales bacterium]
MPTSSSATDSSATGSSAALTAWIERASNMQVPVFSATVADVTSIADSARSSAGDLAVAIGRDAGLTAKILKLANSPLFCQQGRKAQTIGNAVVLLGFDAVRDLAITLSIVNQAELSEHKTPLVDSLLRAFHRAGQARCLATERAQDAPEEVFLAALLSSLGELVFWASGMPENQELAARWQAGASNAAAERDVLGFTLQELSAELVTQWNLGELLQAVVTNPAKDVRVADIQLATDIAAIGSAHEWQAQTLESLGTEPARDAVVTRRAELLEHKKSLSLERIAAQADEVGQIARRFGVTAYTKPKPAPAPQVEPRQQPATDPIRQVALLSEMAQAMQGPVTLDQLLQLALTGIVDGAGFDRVFFALLTPDRRELVIKHRRGEFPGLPKRLSLSANPPIDQALANDGPSLLQSAWPLVGDSTWQSGAESLLHRVTAGRTCVGLLYADRFEHGPSIPPESVAALVLFLQQVTLGLSSPSGR